MADIGCGQGTSTILMAERFPASAFTGFDHSDALIAAARKAADDADLAGRVGFEVADATGFPGRGYAIAEAGLPAPRVSGLGDIQVAHVRQAIRP